MIKGTMCGVAGCEYRSHARGYCRRHYSQIYRKGEIQPDKEEQEIGEKLFPLNVGERIRALERELRRAEMMYQNVIGVAGRLRWRRECDELKKDMIRLGIALPATAKPLADIA